jgi:hypothetical protein
MANIQFVFISKIGVLVAIPCCAKISVLIVSKLPLNATGEMQVLSTAQNAEVICLKPTI